MTNISIRILVSLAILTGAYYLGEYIKTLKPEQVSKQPPVVIPHVEVMEVSRAAHSPAVYSYGNVQSYFETTLTSQVNGRIMSVANGFRVGEKVREGEILALIDDTDYQANLATQEANLVLQQRSLSEEQIRSKQAAEDWLASGRKLASASDFVLRKPQLEAAKANIKSAEAAILKAKADISRAKIVAPYNAIIIERSASVGNFATPQTSLGKLVATEKAEVRIPLSADQMQRIKFSADEKPTMFTLTTPSNPDASWQAEFSRMEPTVDPRNQVSYAIATIQNPYAENTKTLPVGSFVNVSLPARAIQNAYKIPEAAFVNDRYFWVVTAEHTLRKVKGTRVQSASSFAYVVAEEPDIKSPLNVITRPLSTFRVGEKVQRENMGAAKTSSPPKPKGSAKSKHNRND